MRPPAPSGRRIVVQVIASQQDVRTFSEIDSAAGAGRTVVQGVVCHSSVGAVGDIDAAPVGGRVVVNLAPFDGPHGADDAYPAASVAGRRAAHPGGVASDDMQPLQPGGDVPGDIDHPSPSLGV